MWIATGNNRNAKLWNNMQISWEDLKERLKTTTRTPETAGQFRNMTKSQQDSIKDVGGFVGGKLKGGSRKAGNVLERELLTLDADFAELDFCESVSLFADYAYCIYSTHKHSADKPRYRLLIPLSRPCNADEYEAVARMVAFDIGIDMFDDTTYQANRLMYWPSTSYDADYVFIEGEGEPCDVDKILNTYTNWQDVTEWPISSRTVKNCERSLKKQEDPEGKAGIIGAFCRVYSVEKAIDEFLSDKYVPCDIAGRYTYTGGSTAAGLVIYEGGKFAYSNHATDPVSGKLCNAFDLVRIHLFGDLDNDIEPSTPVSKHPSFLKMQDMARDDKQVKALLHKERLENAVSDFGIVDTDDTAEEDDEWVLELEVGRGGKNAATIDNVKLIIKNDKFLKKKIRINEFTGKPIVVGELPWNRCKHQREWLDTDDAGLRHYMEKAYEIKGKSIIEDAWLLVAEENKFHPVREYLKGLRWDGVTRVDTLLIDYMGAEDKEYVRQVTRKSLVAAVARIMEPGIKHDTLLVLVGKQGCGKSEIIKRLGKDWFSDTVTTMAGKEAYEQIQGFWIIEIPELAAMKKMEIETIKHFITKSADSYRAAYGRHVETHQRQCVFFGTTNTYDFLKDPSGNRRFWPVDVNPAKAVKNLFNEFKGDVIDQVWAEAVQLYKNGEKTYIDNGKLSELAQKEQEAHTEESPLTGDVRKYLNKLLPKGWDSMSLSERRAFIREDGIQGEIEGTEPRSKVCPMEIWCELFMGEKKDLTTQKSRELRDVILKTGEWGQCKSNISFGKLYGNQRGFKKNT